MNFKLSIFKVELFACALMAEGAISQYPANIQYKLNILPPPTSMWDKSVWVHTVSVVNSDLRLPRESVWVHKVAVVNSDLRLPSLWRLHVCIYL